MDRFCELHEVFPFFSLLLRALLDFVHRTTRMGIIERFLPKEDRYAALMLYGMILAMCFNGYDAGIMTVSQP